MLHCSEKEIYHYQICIISKILQYYSRNILYYPEEKRILILNYSHHCLIIASTPEKHWIK